MSSATELIFTHTRIWLAAEPNKTAWPPLIREVRALECANADGLFL
jgi:hypothetical protein